MIERVKLEISVPDFVISWISWSQSVKRLARTAPSRIVLYLEGQNSRNMSKHVKTKCKVWEIRISEIERFEKKRVRRDMTRYDKI